MRSSTYKFGFLIVLLSACQGARETTANGSLNPQAVCGSDAWDNYAGAFFSTQCSACHGWTQDKALINGQLSKIRSEVATGEMPKGRALAANEQSRFLSWIDCGAQGLTAAPAPVGTTPVGDDDADDDKPKAAYCETCAADSDCADEEARCIAGNDKPFCSRDCRADQDCPSDSTCVEVVDAAGESAGFSCYPKSDVCGVDSATVDKCTTETWTNKYSAWFSATCAGCHKKWAKSYSEIVARADKIKEEVEERAMPKNKSLAQGDIDNLIKWIECGLPE